MSDYTQEAANQIAELTLIDEAASGDERIVQTIAGIMGSSSQTLEEAFLTAVRVRRAEKRAREMLQTRADERDNAATDATSTETEVEATADSSDDPAGA